MSHRVYHDYDSTSQYEKLNQINNDQYFDGSDSFFSEAEILALSEKEDASLYQTIIDKLGLTKYSWQVYFIVTMFFLADGGEMMVLSLILSRISIDWNMSSSEKGLLGSAVFIGLFIGVLICGKISDTIGRKPVFISGSSIVTVFAVLSAFSFGYFSFFFCRLICGFGIGLSMPSAFALATEITPSKYRHYVISLVYIFFPFGEMFIICLAKYFLPFPHGWRYILAFASLPCLLALIVSFYISESPKFLFTIGNYSKGFQSLQHIINTSKKKIQLTKTIRKRLVEEFSSGMTTATYSDQEVEFYDLSREPHKESNLGDVKFSDILSEEYKTTTILLWINFFCVSAVYYGMIYILPQIFEKRDIELNKNAVPNYEDDSYNISDSNFIDLIISAFIELPSMFLGSFLASYGRKQSIYWGYLLSLVFAFLCLSTNKFFDFNIAMLKFFICIPDVNLMIFACEAYPTKIRSLGVGLANSVYRIGGMMTPFLNQILFDLDYVLPFYLFLFGSLVGTIVTYMLPYDTMNRNIK
jgi:putative MFS transporter